MSRSSMFTMSALMKITFDSWSADVRVGGVEGREKCTCRVVVERRVNAAMLLDFVARADERAHPTAPRQSGLKRLEPVCIRASCFVVGGTECLQGADDQVVALTVVEVLKETQEVK